MLYITGVQALNLPCSLDTCGDWHTSAMDWENLCLWDTDTTLFKDYGIELCAHVPGYKQPFYIANTLRALLDILIMNDMSAFGGARDDFICNDKYTLEFFEKVAQLCELPHWHDIDVHMVRSLLCSGLNIRRRREYVPFRF